MRLAAFLRGINVGRAKRVAMGDLRSLVEGLGYANVRTLLNSGNLVFAASRVSPARVATQIEEALEAKFHVSSRVIVLTEPEMAAIVTGNPIGKIADNPARLLVAVLRSSADVKRVEALTRRDWAPDLAAVGPRAVYMWCPGGIMASSLAAEVGRALGDGTTVRNWSTLKKVHEALAQI
jgi:uncharacterized protein (DUF1697 family)